MDTATVNLVGAVAAAISAAGGLYAAWAAHRSAVSSDKSARHAEHVHLRGLVHELSIVANEVVSETLKSDALCNELKSAYRELFTHAGQGAGSSRLESYLSAVETKQARLTEPQQQARSVADRISELHAASENDVSLALSKTAGARIAVQRLREELERELDSVTAQNQTYRQAIINNVVDRHGP